MTAQLTTLHAGQLFQVIFGGSIASVSLRLGGRRFSCYERSQRCVVCPMRQRSTTDRHALPETLSLSDQSDPRSGGVADLEINRPVRQHNAR